LSFNLTHTRGFAACAVTTGVRVGIDAEDIRRQLAIAEIAARWYAPGERRLLARLPERQRGELFFRIWTLKEAILKAAGCGLRLDPRRFAVDPDRGGADVPDSLGIPTSWRLAQFAPAPYIRLALALPGCGRLAPAIGRVGFA
jgi:4'-phosphopantetheinyl transferase